MRPRPVHRTAKSNPKVLEASRHLRMDYVDSSDFDDWLSASGNIPLAIVSFGDPAPRSVQCPSLTLDLPQLAARPQLEVWSGDQPVTGYRDRGFTAAMCGDFLAATMIVDERPGIGISGTTEEAYLDLLGRLRSLGFPYPWRIWNYFQGINEEEDGLERYRQFCVGRHQALLTMLPGFPDSLPAGTAVGTRSGPLQILVLAGTRPGIHLGNPRQIHAYEYPSRYGPCSPSFARATLLQSEISTQLFIGGTASIVGHESRHLGLAEAQAQETLHNLRALISHAENSFCTMFGRHSTRACFKVYVRNPEDLRVVQHALNSSSLASNHVLYLQGELCRRELLVEIEGLLTRD